MCQKYGIFETLPHLKETMCNLDTWYREGSIATKKWLDSMSRKSLHYYLIAKNKDIVGVILSLDYTIHKKDESFLWGFVIKGDYQGKEIGTQVLNKLKKKYLNRKIILDSKDGVQNFYVKNNFRFWYGKYLMKSDSNFMYYT